MKACVINWMELEFVKNRSVSFAIAQSQVNNVSCWSVGDFLKIFCVYCEKDVFHPKTVKIAWYQTLSTESLDYGFVASLTDLAFQFEMLHCLNIKCVTQSETCPDPIAPKA